MKTIIAPTNFSKESNHALSYAADMAASLRADLLLLHVIQMPVSFDGPVAEYNYDGFVAEAEENLAQIKKELLIRTENEINIAFKAVPGNLEHKIGEICKADQPFIVVIGSERKNWAERALFGSNTFNIVKNLHYPVLVVPPNANFRQIKRIGLAADFKSVYDMPLQIIRELVEIFDAAVDIIHVRKREEVGLTRKLSLYLLKQRLKEFNPGTKLILNNKVEDGLNEFAKQHHEDVLVVIAREYKFPQKLFHKSTSHAIALNSAVPVLAIAE